MPELFEMADAALDAFRLTFWTTKDGWVRYETRINVEEAK